MGLLFNLRIRIKLVSKLRGVTCGQLEETTGHILWECPFAHNVQALVRGKIQKTNSLTTNFFLLMRQMLERLSSKEFELWAMVTWSLWNAHNKVQSRNAQSHLEEIFKQAMSLMEEYHKLVRDLIQR